MGAIVYVESSEGIVKKTSLEAVAYAAAMGKSVIAVALGSSHDTSSLAGLGKYGASEVLFDNSKSFDNGDAGIAAEALATLAKSKGCDTFVLATSPFGSALAARTAIRLDASLATNVTEIPQGSKVRRSIFTGKAFQEVELTEQFKVIAIKKNAVDLSATGNEASVTTFSASVESSAKVKVTGTEKVEGDILLPEAERVVSAGRGLKGPENWHMIEELAKVLGAATACSKPVSDMGWRPHHEHVGQTGIKVSPQLYIAVGISGAIQHLAGVNSSKNIVVINKDPEAPFFKEADYGIVGDAFEVVPKLIEALKKVN